MKKNDSKREDIELMKEHMQFLIDDFGFQLSKESVWMSEIYLTYIETSKQLEVNIDRFDTWNFVFSIHLWKWYNLFEHRSIFMGSDLEAITNGNITLESFKNIRKRYEEEDNLKARIVPNTIVDKNMELIVEVLKNYLSDFLRGDYSYNIKEVRKKYGLDAKRWRGFKKG